MRALTIVIPLHNEAPGVSALAARLRQFLETEADCPVDFVLVDDGSTDGTHDLLREHFADLPHQVLRHETNLGLSRALVTGSKAARGDLIGWLDSDLTYDPGILVPLLAAIDDGAEIAMASCYHPEGNVDGVAGWRRALSEITSRAYRLLSGRPIHTFTCMVRVYRRDVLEQCPLTRPHFLGVTEVLLRALQQDRRVAEVPATLHRRRLGQSKMRILRVAFGHLTLVPLALRARW